MEQRISFSTSLAKELNEGRMGNDILPAYDDGNGNLIINFNGQAIPIEGSKDPINGIITDPFDPRVVWPENTGILEYNERMTEEDKEFLGLPIPQLILGVHHSSMTPVVILGKALGEMKMGNGSRTDGLLYAYIIIRDSQGKPIAARPVEITGSMSLFDDNLWARSGGMDELSDFWQKLEEDRLYYLLFANDQPKRFSESFPSLVGEATDGNPGYMTTDQSTRIFKDDQLFEIKESTLVIGFGLVIIDN